MMDLAALTTLDRWPTLLRDQVARSTDGSILFPEHRSEPLSPGNPEYAPLFSQMLERVVQRARLLHYLYTTFNDTLDLLPGKFDGDDVPLESDGETLRQDVKSKNWGWKEVQQYEEDLTGLYERMTRILLLIPHPGLVYSNTTTLRYGLLSSFQSSVLQELIRIVNPDSLA